MTVAGNAIEYLQDSVLACVGKTPLITLSRLFPEPGVEVLAKLELMNPGGSLKDRPARYFIEKGLADGSIPPGAHLLESSSENFGIALAITARLHGLTLTCVVDPKTTPANISIICQLGVDIDIVHEPDDAGGYLQTRIRRVQELLHEMPAAVWINQRFPDLRVIAVDAVGSVIFGGPPGRREIPHGWPSCSTATSAQPSDFALTEQP
jgi:N-(2-amino-2-carboxyethyl)-L-glutamate synthase